MKRAIVNSDDLTAPPPAKCRMWFSASSAPMRRGGSVIALSMLLAVAVQAYAGAMLRGLYADGAFFASQLAARQGLCIIQPARSFSEVLTQWPVVIAMHLGARTPYDVAMAFSLSANIVPGLLILASGLALPKTERHLFVFPAFIYFAGILSAQFASVTEGLAATAYVWLVLTLIAFGRLTAPRGILLAALAAGCLHLHEEMGFLGPVLVAACAMRLRQEQHLPQRLLLVFVALCAVASIVTGAEYSLHPFDAGERGSFVRSFLNLEWLYTQGGGVNLCCILGIGAALCILAALVRTALGRPALFVFLPLSLAAGAAAFVFPGLIVPSTHFAARDNGALLSLPVGILFLLAKGMPRFRAAITASPIIGLVSSLGLGVSLWHVAATLEWSADRTYIVHTLRTHKGILAWNDVLSTADARQRGILQIMSWPWTNPDISLVLLPRKTVESVLANPEHYTGWQPYDLRNPLTLPSFPGVVYTYLKH